MFVVKFQHKTINYIHQMLCLLWVLCFLTLSQVGHSEESKTRVLLKDVTAEYFLQLSDSFSAQFLDKIELTITALNPQITSADFHPRIYGHIQPPVIILEAFQIPEIEPKTFTVKGHPFFNLIKIYTLSGKLQISLAIKNESNLDYALSQLEDSFILTFTPLIKIKNSYTSITTLDSNIVPNTMLQAEEVVTSNKDLPPVPPTPKTKIPDTEISIQMVEPDRTPVPASVLDVPSIKKIVSKKEMAAQQLPKAPVASPPEIHEPTNIEHTSSQEVVRSINLGAAQAKQVEQVEQYKPQPLDVWWQAPLSPKIRKEEKQLNLLKEKELSQDGGVIETTLFDLYLSDIQQGLILANYTDSWFEIENPKDILDQFKQIKNVPGFSEAFSGRIYNTKTIEGIGKISIDLNTFRIIVVLEPQFLEGKDITLTGKMPDPENNFSLQQKFGVTASRDSISNSSSSYRHRTLTSIGKYFTKIDGTFLEDNKYELDEGSFGAIVLDEFNFDLGLLRTEGQLFTASADVLGMKFETSQDLLLEQNDFLRGSRLALFVPSRATVEFFRDNRLLDVQDLDFGLQEIDTSRFPQGSYDILVRIKEDNGNLSEETQFFTKSGFLATRSRPIYVFQAGILRDDLDLYNVPVYQAGVRWRANAFLELESAINGTDSFTIASGQAKGLWRSLIFNLGYAFSNEGEHGVISYGSGRVFDINWNLGITKTFGTTTSPDPITSTTSSFLRDKLNVLGTDRTTLSGNVYKKFGPTELRFAYSKNRRNLNNLYQERYTYGPSFRWLISTGSTRSVYLDISYLSTERGDRFSTYLAFRQKLNNTLSVSSRMSHRNQALGQDESVLQTAVNYDNREKTGRGTRVYFDNELKDSEQDSSESMVNSLNVEHTNNYLDIGVFTRDRRLTASNGTNYGINADSSFLVSNKGVHISYPPKHEAVLIADIKSETTRSKFELVINDSIYDIIEAGTSTSIGLSPYRTYDVTIRPIEESELTFYDSTTHTITLFPGNIQHRVWSVNKIFIILGRVVDKEGTPIPLERIQGTIEYTATEEDGTFQSEISGTETLKIKSDRYNCTLMIPKMEKYPEYFIDLGDVICQ